MKKLLLLIVLAFLPFFGVGQTEGYKNLQNSLRAFSDNRNFTVFRGMDYNWAGPNIDSYIQMELGYGSKDFKMTEQEIIHTYIPKASKNSEILKLTYKTDYRTDINGAYDADGISIIKSVEIIGPASTIVQMFTEYWPIKTTLGDLTGGDAFAYKEVLGDYITLRKVNNAIMKINISRGNMDVDYTTTYGINTPK